MQRKAGNIVRVDKYSSWDGRPKYANSRSQISVFYSLLLTNHALWLCLSAKYVWNESNFQQIHIQCRKVKRNSFIPYIPSPFCDKCNYAILCYLLGLPPPRCLWHYCMSHYNMYVDVMCTYVLKTQTQSTGSGFAMKRRPLHYYVRTCFVFFFFFFVVFY